MGVDHMWCRFSVHSKTRTMYMTQAVRDGKYIVWDVKAGFAGIVFPLNVSDKSDNMCNSLININMGLHRTQPRLPGDWILSLSALIISPPHYNVWSYMIVTE